MLIFKNRLFIAFGFVICLMACNSTPTATPNGVLTPISAESTPLVATPTITPTQVMATITPTVSVPPTETPSPIQPMVGEPILPASIYFIHKGNGQLMRLERDGFTLNQITQLGNPISDYDLSADGTLLAYISDQSLVLKNLVTGEMTVKVARPNTPLGVKLEQKYEIVRSPQFADDNISLLYAQNGLRTVPTSGDGAVNILYKDSLIPNGDPNATVASQPLRLFNGGSWSPDFQHIVANFNYYPEGGNLGIHSFVDGSFTELTGDISCCEFTWSADGKMGYVTSDIAVYGNPGLSQVDVATGEATTIVGYNGINDDGNISYFRSGHILGDGALLTFVAPEVDASLNPLYQMYKISAEPFTATPLRQDSYFLGTDILWAEDGTGAVITEGKYDSSAENTGTAYWLKSAESLSVALPINGSNLQWGGRPQPVITVPDAAVSDLKQIALQQWGGTLPSDMGEIAVRQLLGKDALWVAYTTGIRSFEPNFNHQIALYRYANQSWQLAAAYQFTQGAGAELGGPDYLSDGSVKQVFIDSESTWLFVEGGVGAHGGLLYVLRFDGVKLSAVVSNGNGTPSVGRVEDINGDSRPEILLDRSDAYIFAYATGVRYIDYEVLSWKTSGVVETMTLQIVNEPTISPTIQTLNNQAVGYAKADLLQDAKSAIDSISEDATLPDAIKWNKILINFILKERTNAQNSYDPFPLLSSFFIGDYAEVVKMMRSHTPQELFNTPSVLVTGTMAEGNEASMGERLVKMTTAALVVKPNSAEAYYIRAWGKYLINPDDTTIIADLKMAADQAPTDSFYQNTLTSWK